MYHLFWPDKLICFRPDYTRLLCLIHTKFIINLSWYRAHCSSTLNSDSPCSLMSPGLSLPGWWPLVFSSQAEKRQDWTELFIRNCDDLLVIISREFGKGSITNFYSLQIIQSDGSLELVCVRHTSRSQILISVQRTVPRPSKGCKIESWETVNWIILWPWKLFHTEINIFIYEGFSL